jgi:hypothetical protein
VSWLLPSALAIGAVGAALAVVAHFFARTTPEPMAFPTARFIPRTIASATRAARRPTDLLLLALRLAAIMLAAAAFAGPVFHSSGSGTVRVVLVDSTGTVADATEVLDSLATLTVPGSGDVVIPIDSAGLSAALVRARRTATGFAADRDSAELVIISAFDSSLLDAATLEIRSQWSGRARLVHVRSRELSRSAEYAAAGGIDAGDPLRATLVLGGWLSRGAEGPGAFRLERTDPVASRSALGDSSMVMLWPATTAANDSAARPRAVVVGDLVVPLLADEGYPGSGVPIARWETGAPAATLSRAGGACVVTVGVRPVLSGDLPLRDDFRELVGALLGACAPAVVRAPIDSAARATLRGDGPLLGLSEMRRADATSERASAWLLLAAAAALLIELPLRRRRPA